jgi:hypothetical protein
MTHVPADMNPSSLPILMHFISLHSALFPQDTHEKKYPIANGGFLVLFSCLSSI